MVKSFIYTKDELKAYGERRLKYTLDGQQFDIALKPYTNL
jgi:hypothetical protein